MIAAWRLPIGRMAIATWIFATLAMGSLAVVLQSRDRSSALESFSDLRAYSANAAADTINRILGTMDILFSQAIADWQVARAPLDQLFLSISDAERRISRSLLALDGLSILGPDGRIRHSLMTGVVGVDVSDRDYFTVHRKRPRLGMWIGEPVSSRIVPGQRRLPVSWPIQGPGGEFAGVLWASLSQEVLSRVLFNYRDTEDSFVALVSAAGATLGADRLQRHVSIPQSIVQAAAAGGRTAIVANATVDGITGTWHLAARKIGDTGLTVILGATEEEMLRQWTTRTLTIGALILVIVLLLGGFTIVILRLAAHERASTLAARAAAERAVIADGTKTEFLAVMSHEIRTPLTAIIGMAELLATARLDDMERRQVQAIRTGGRQMLSVVNDVLDFTRLGAGGIELERIAFSLPALLEEVRSTMGPAAHDKGLALSIDAQRAPGPDLMGDPNRIRQILLNLVGNAVKFTERGGITLTVAAADGHAGFVRFTVEDTGIGIASDRIGRLFQPFSQADTSMARRFGGSGLGLAICRRLVETMGGSVSVDSILDGGSRFYFDIPLEPASRPLVETAPEADVEPARLTLLVAEDVDINRDLIRTMLEAKGHRLTMVCDGAEAVAAVSANRFDAVLMDVQMPVMDGVEATRRIRALPGPERDVPIIALTANVLTGARQSYLAAGMSACVDKPISWAELDKTLAHLIRAAREGNHPAPQRR
ncbi:hypothetical protein STVA_24480 [Allostella vacuolata]|nr:hypothetical protein STVA_24480 [Stella vacuolata]